jgi:hypothetical protein
MPGDPDDSRDTLRRTDRIVLLAELLFNLQDIEGIDEVVTDIQRGELKAAFEELEGASQLKKDGIPFRFLAPSRSHLEGTPDLEILLSDQQSVLYETKGKAESSDFSIAKMRSSLEDAARRQLRKDRPGMILLKIPEAWPREPKLAFMAQNLLKDFFSRTPEVVAVNLRWDEYLPNGQGGEARSYYRIERNHSSQFLTPAIEDMLCRIGSRLGPEWIRLQKVIRRVFEAPGKSIIHQTPSD